MRDEGRPPADTPCLSHLSRQMLLQQRKGRSLPGRARTRRAMPSGDVCTIQFDLQAFLSWDLTLTPR